MRGSWWRAGIAAVAATLVAVGEKAVANEPPGWNLRERLEDLLPSPDAPFRAPDLSNFYDGLIERPPGAHRPDADGAFVTRPPEAYLSFPNAFEQRPPQEYLDDPNAFVRPPPDQGLPERAAPDRRTPASPLSGSQLTLPSVEFAIPLQRDAGPAN